MSEREHAELDLATMDALRGAADVRRRLMLEMSTGTPAITDLAYAVKVRIKEDFKVVEKVLRKRRGAKPDYSVNMLRDLVGLRIVTLYRLDALDILPILLEKIETGSRESDSVFSRRGVEEVIIYSVNPTGDAQDLPGRVEALCRAFGLSDRTKPDQTPQNYTSIHIVVWCRGKYRGAYRDIPVEVQVRTAFEDVWSEIDHSLKYKREAENDVVDRDATSRLELNEAHLNVMKTIVDGLAQYADQIKLQMDGDKRLRARGSRRSEQAVDRLGAVPGLDQSTRHMVEKVVAAAQETYEGTSGSANAIRAARRRVAGDLIRTAENLRALKIPAEHQNELLYVVEMERALLLFEVGNDLRGAEGNANLVEASRIYADMADLFPFRPVPLYRLARTLDELGDKLAARRRYKDAVDALEGSDLAETHWLRGAAPRLLGFALWEDAARRAEASVDAEETNRALAGLLEAIDLTKRAMEATPSDPHETAKARNNLLYFCLDYRDHGGSEEALARRGLGREGLNALLSELTASAGDDFARWDTVRSAHVRLGDPEGAASASRKVMSLLDDPERRERWTTNEGIAQREARRTLQELGNGGDEKEDRPEAT